MIKNESKMEEEEEYHPDILFLQNRLEYLLAYEQYEKIPTIKRWIKELIELYHNKNNKN